MGCTSSAPNMVAANLNATEKISEFSEEETEQSIKEDDDIISAEEENGKNEIKVLPSCDTLAHPIQLDSNNKSMIDTSNSDMEKDFPNEENVTESVTEIIAKENAVVEEKMSGEIFSSLEDVVEKVVELYVTDNLINSTQNVPKQADQIDDSIEKAVEEPEQIPEQSLELTEESQEQKFREIIKVVVALVRSSPHMREVDGRSELGQEWQDTPYVLIREEALEEAISPSQSTSSRATRWEALADIAAELPPSLTVDPLTGQIYALSK